MFLKWQRVFAKRNIFSLDGEYRIAPGWTAALSVNFVDANNINGSIPTDNNQGSVVIFSNAFRF